MHTISYLGNILVPITQSYALAVLWNTTLKLPYTIPEVVTLLASALAVASMLSLTKPDRASEEEDDDDEEEDDDDEEGDSVPPIIVGYTLLTLHLISLVITLYCLEYKAVFHWPKDYLCFVILAMVLVVTLVAIVIANSIGHKDEAVKYTLLGYSILLMVPTLWYAYRCGLFKWCLPKKKGLKATDSAENTTPDTDIANE
uniref:Membrane protein n=1 Tax=Babesia bovis TaxID=5865 RepID=S6BL86_BABBO|nr:membrane protein [Babesia bovis]